MKAPCAPQSLQSLVRASLDGQTDTRGTGSGDEERRTARNDLSGVRLLRDGKDAFAARVLLARAAERTLDVQYYIWRNDLSGSLMLDEIEAAADRGVRVRLLLDDNGIPGLDEKLASLDIHPNVEVRLFNPFAIRKPKLLNWLFDFKRLNRRMHSRSFTADNQVAILGGRNIGDEYFGARQDGLFADLDVLMLGPIVPKVSQAFDRCWDSVETRPARQILIAVSPAKRDRHARQSKAIAQSKEAQSYREAIVARPLFADLIDGELGLVWAPVCLVDDNTVAPQEHGDGQTGLADLMPAGFGRPNEELILISGYFVPTAAGTESLAGLAQSGIAVRVLTNSYAATDVGVVHAGYAPYRERLLKAGVRLFEMPAPDDKPKTAGKFLKLGSTHPNAARHAGRTLHAKVFVLDDKRLYVGSANFDPRSAHLNTELGVVIESPKLAGEISRLFKNEFAPNSYRLGLDSSARLQWTDERDENPRPEYVEPSTSVFSRAFIWLLSKVPMTWLL